MARELKHLPADAMPLFPSRLRHLVSLMSVCAAFATATLAQPAPDGRWTGAIQIAGTHLQIDVHFNAKAGSAAIDIPAQAAFGLPLRNVGTSPDSVYFELPAGPGLAIFESTSISEQRIVGRFTQAGVTGEFFLEPNPQEVVAEAIHAAETAVSVEVEGGSLFGAIASPEAGSKTLVILHAGSGPTTRDGNTRGLPSGNNSLLLLSDALVNNGFAVLRFDKRGVGEGIESSSREEDLRLETYVADLVAWVNKARAEGEWDQIVLAGHSEGALIASLAASEVSVDGLISIAGAGRPAPDILREQLSRNLPPNLYAESDRIIAALTRGETTDSSPPELAALFRASVQPYLISWFRHDPAEILGSLAIPTLVVQGTTDLQISVADAERLAASRNDIDLVVIDGMNHVLKDVAGDLAAQTPSYGNPSLPVNTQLVDVITAFISDL